MQSQDCTTPSSKEEGLLHKEEYCKQFQHWFNENYEFSLKENGKYGLFFIKHIIKAMEQEIGSTPNGNWDLEDKKLFVQLGLEKDHEINKIKLLQAALAYRGYWSYEIDGIFSEQLKEQIAQFQKDNQLAWDGNVGFTTISKIFGKKIVEGEYEQSRAEATREEISQEWYE